MITNFSSLRYLSIRQKIIITNGVDCILMYIALALAIYTQPLQWYDYNPDDYLIYIMIAPIGLYACHITGHYRTVLQHLGYSNIVAALKGLTLGALIWGFSAELLNQITNQQKLPFIIPVLYLAYICAMIIGIRYLARYCIYYEQSQTTTSRKPVVIHGTREAGVQLIQALMKHSELIPVAVISSTPDRIGRNLMGLRIYGMNDLEFVFKNYGVKEMILTRGGITDSEKQKIFRAVANFDVQLRTLPSLTDVASGKYIVDYIKNVDVIDLLGRSKVQSSNGTLDKAINGNRILITGGGGSIGSELAIQISGYKPKIVVIFEQSELHYYDIERQLLKRGVKNFVVILGTILDKQRIDEVITKYNINIIYHAAALKHVPIAECNPIETAKVNILGTLNLLECASEHKIERLVLISTDKAVRPTNLMGASKRFAEILLQYYQELYPETIFTAVRFGNVLGTSGSVVPLFREQIKAGGPITITHPDVTRYFMAVDEAVELVLQAGYMAKGGEVFLLDMGKPVKVYDMAVNMIRLSGQSLKSPENTGGDIEIQFTGLRPGEKLFEELLIDASTAEPTSHPKISRAKDSSVPANLAKKWLAQIKKFIHNQKADELKNLLIQISFYNEVKN